MRDVGFGTSTNLQDRRSLQLKVLEAQYEERFRLQGAHLGDIQKLLEAERQEKATLYGVMKTMAKNQGPKNDYRGSTFVKGDQYKQDGTFGIGHNSGEIQAGAKVAGVINEAEQKSLAEAAAEIQQLLEQLDKTYGTDTTVGKMAIATDVIKQLEANPPLRNRLLSAIGAGSTSALEALLNHPAASFVIGALQDWRESGKAQP